MSKPSNLITVEAPVLDFCDRRTREVAMETNELPWGIELMCLAGHCFVTSKDIKDPHCWCGEAQS